MEGKNQLLEENGKIKVTESFDPEALNPHEMQRAGWQAILDNFKNILKVIDRIISQIFTSVLERMR